MLLHEYAEIALVTESPHPVMTEESVRLIHSALGLVSEAAELSEGWREALRMDATPAEADAAVLNVKEELGDCFWFMSLGRKALQEHMPYSGRLPKDMPGGLTDFKACAAKFADNVKARVYYGKNNICQLILDLDEIEDCLETLIRWGNEGPSSCRFIVGDRDSLLAGNIAKLKARYGGKFSQTAALNRDKDAEYAAIAAI